MKSIRSKIMWLLFSTVLISSLIIGILGVTLTSNVIEKSSNDNMNLLCKTNANEIDILLAKVEDSVDTLAHYAVSELPNKKELQDDSIRAKYLADLETSALHHIESTKSAMAVYIRFDDSYINDSDGFFFVKNKNTAEFEKQPLTDISAYDENDTEHVGWWYIPTRNGEPTWIEAYYNANIKHEIISYIVPIYQHEQLVGVIGADISTDYIEQLVKNIYVFSSGKAAVLKSDGTVIYHPNFKRGELIGEGDAGFEGVVEKLAQEQSTSQLIKYQLDGVDKRIASCKLRNGMLIVCFAPVSEIYKEQHSLIVATIIITAIVIAVGLVTASFVSRAFARPIKKLNEAAKSLIDGEFEFGIISDTDDEIGELTTTFIETRKILKHQIHLLDTEAHRDGLTKLGNKSAFTDREAELNHEIDSGVADFSIAVFDVNKLKITNDVFGHMAGDKLLLTVSEHLSSIFEPADIYRLGGDEFVVIMSGEQHQNSRQLLQTCIDKIKTLSVEGYPECRVSCAYGISWFDPKTDHQLTDVLQRADKEMYKNKTLTKKETFPWQEGMKGIKQLQVEKYCQLLETLTVSTDDYLFLMNTETGVIRFFGKIPNFFNVADGQELSNGISDMLAYVHVNDQELVKNAVSSVVNHDVEMIDINFRMHDDKESMYWVNCRGSVIKDDMDNHFVVIGRISQNAVKHLYNPLTTLFNKTKLKADLQKGNESEFGFLMLLDIDNLSEINLKHGSVYGDKLLKMLAEELENRFTLWQIYHVEKDRFVVLLNVDSSKEAEKIHEDIQKAMNKCSLSASVVPNSKSLYASAENIYDYAVQILNNAKKNGTGQIAISSAESLLKKMSEVELVEELKESVQNKCKGFHLVYQPQISAKDYSILSAEVLLRFESREKGQIYPNLFIPILEQTRLINEVGLWVVNEALSQCKEWRKAIPNFKISVNISSKQLEHKKFVAQITRLLSKHNLPGEALILEITESAQLDENEEVFALIERFKKVGIQIAIDDFGTGYSNLSNLKHIHANILKIDRIFIKDVKEGGYNYNLIYNVLEFAKSNALKVCLEGVETTEEFIVLSKLQPDIFQGYLFDKPCTSDVLEAKYFKEDSEEYVKRLRQVEQLSKERIHAPVVNVETKAILRGIDVGLWIIRVNSKTGEAELYTDETLKKALGIETYITPKECYKYWKDNINEKYLPAVGSMMTEMMKSDKIIQVEYAWNHPTKKEVMVRCSGRCVETNGEIMVFEGFHRTISDLGKSF